MSTEAVGHRQSKNRTGVLFIAVFLNENETVALLKPFSFRNKLKKEIRSGGVRERETNLLVNLVSRWLGVSFPSQLTAGREIYINQLDLHVK